MSRIGRVAAWAIVPTVLVVLGSMAFAGGPEEGRPAADQGREADPRTTLAIQGFERCQLGSPSCSTVWVSMDFYAAVTGDDSVRYPEDYGLPECPEPSHDPGFEPGESVDQDVLEAAPECAVHPRMAVSPMGLGAESAVRFFETYGCGQSMKAVCQREDL